MVEATGFEPYGPEPYALPTALRLIADTIIYSYCFSVKRFLSSTAIKFAKIIFKCYNSTMTIHHDKLAYGKVTSNSEEMSEKQILEMLKLLEGEEEQEDIKDGEIQTDKNIKKL